MTINVYPPYGSNPNSPVNIAFPPTALDAFGRLQVSEPYTLFDSQNRFATDNQFDTALTGTGTTSFLTNEAAVNMEVTSGGVGSVVRQSYRSMPYQPGKGLLVLATFVMSGSTSANLTQRAGYFNSENGVFFQKVGSTLSFVLRSYVTGSASDARTVNQSSWNGDKLDGTGPSGITLDPTKAQILWMDFEWLGVGSVRCGFIINGIFYLCHTFNNANIISNVYMTTATLPVRYEITSVTAAVAASMKQICSTVISEGGYEQASIDHVARRTTVLGTINTAANFLPVVSIRLAAGRTGAVVIPNRIQFQPTTNQNYELALIKNPTLTGATFAATVPSDSNVEFDVAATAISAAGTIVQTGYIASSGGGGTASTLAPTGYNWDLQLGATIAGVSDIYTLGVRTISGATTGDGVGSISFYDLTQ
ncbi:MAG: hypothetical protein QM523_00195 [Candidatus Pacebacteria bacterium]|nr:hypothetical protein [Candidatus Paceibacterota bacterium]